MRSYENIAVQVERPAEAAVAAKSSAVQTSNWQRHAEDTATTTFSHGIPILLINVMFMIVSAMIVMISIHIITYLYVLQLLSIEKLLLYLWLLLV